MSTTPSTQLMPTLSSPPGMPAGSYSSGTGTIADPSPSGVADKGRDAKHAAHGTASTAACLGLGTRR